MELTPRTGPDAEGPSGAAGTTTDRPPRAPKKRSLPVIVVIVLVLAAGGYVMLQALGSAATFYRNVDEAVAQQDTLGTKRFRIQGTVVPGTIDRTGNGVDFEITYNGVEIPVQHRGDPPEMFKDNEPVLLEGHFAGDGTTTYDSDLIIVKHDENYVSDNEERLKEAEQGGQVPVDAVTENGTSEAGGS